MKELDYLLQLLDFVRKNPNPESVSKACKYLNQILPRLRNLSYHEQPEHIKQKICAIWGQCLMLGYDNTPLAKLFLPFKVTMIHQSFCLNIIFPDGKTLFFLLVDSRCPALFTDLVFGLYKQGKLLDLLEIKRIRGNSLNVLAYMQLKLRTDSFIFEQTKRTYNLWMLSSSLLICESFLAALASLDMIPEVPFDFSSYRKLIMQATGKPVPPVSKPVLTLYDLSLNPEKDQDPLLLLDNSNGQLTVFDLMTVLYPSYSPPPSCAQLNEEFEARMPKRRRVEFRQG